MSPTARKYFSPVFCWLIVALIYMLTYALLVVPELIISQLKTDFHVNLSAIGFYSACFLYSWIIMQIPAGILFDHYDSRKLVFFSTLVIVIACILQYYTLDFGWGLLSRILMGAASSFSLIGALYLSRTWFSVTLLPVMIGITQAMSGISEIGFPVIFAQLSYKNIHWTAIILYLGIGLLILALLALFFVRDSDYEQRNKKRRSSSVNLKIILGNRYLWGLGIYVGFAVAYFIAFADMWGVDTFKHQFGLDTVDAVYLNSTIVFGFMIGCPLIGWFSRYLPRRILILICMVIEYVLMTLLNYFVFGIDGQIVGLFVLGFFTGGIILAFDMIKEIVTEAHYGLALGFLNIFFGLIGVMLTALLGYVIMLKGGADFYEPLIMQITGATATIASLFIAWRYKFDHTKEFEKK